MFKAEIASKQAVYTLGLPTRQFPLWVPKLKHCVVAMKSAQNSA
jgi:hypothetical protein